MSRRVPRYIFIPYSWLFLFIFLFHSIIWAGNVILYVGDGAGLAQIASARIAANGPDGRLTMDQLPHLCVVTTHSANALTTDSAAGATAWATGCKTNNGFLGVSPAGNSLKTILEYARDAGFFTGLVTTTRITHATPAAFTAHVEDRNAEALIAQQMLASRPNVLLGGGRSFWVPSSWSESKRYDESNLLEEARKIGYEVIQEKAAFEALDIEKVRYLLGLFTWGHFPYAFDRYDSVEPTLKEMTAIAIRILEKSDKGFFLMVEGGRIDHALHDNDAIRTIREILDLDQAISCGLEYARNNPQTLVIFTADHETGGMSFGNRLYDSFPEISPSMLSSDKDADWDYTMGIGWTTKGHTAVPVIASAVGPYAEQLHGVIDNVDLFAIMVRALGLPVHYAHVDKFQ